MEPKDRNPREIDARLDRIQKLVEQLVEAERVRNPRFAANDNVQAPLPNGWFRIEKAPRDGSKIDIWCVNPDDSNPGNGVRFPNCNWRQNHPDPGGEWGWVRSSEWHGHWVSLEKGDQIYPPWKPAAWRYAPLGPFDDQA
jgi:hypothetical protein